MCLADIIIPEPLKYTYNDEYFIWKYSGFGDPDRIFIFVTEQNIKLLGSFQDWYMDGKFDVAVCFILDAISKMI